MSDCRRFILYAARNEAAASGWASALRVFMRGPRRAHAQPLAIVNSHRVKNRHQIQHTVQGRNSSVEEFIGKHVVVDVEAPFVYLGRLHAIHEKTLVLKGVDVHDLRDSTTTREVYVRESRVHGIQPNRKTVYIRLEKVVSISPLEDVIE